MYDTESGTRAKARNTTLNEELGQIEYIFSDKTGTLTRNIMTFNKCSIKGKVYGNTPENQQGGGRGSEMDEEPTLLDFSDNPMAEPDFKFYDKSLLDDVRKGDPNVHEFFRLLALCHTVMPEYKEGNLEYQAQSPDENALVSSARNFGFVFTKRTPRSITITFSGVEEVYELLCILDFNNVRKRMSVILRKDGKIRLYCKGADVVIFERLRPGQEDLKTTTQDHLDNFAVDGLRTLCLGTRDLTEQEFSDWKAAHHNAAISLENREEKLDAVYNQIETDLDLLGATAIEDKLQDGVPRTIGNLRSAGIKIWVLTGDKQETAINIGYSCQLLGYDLIEEPFIVDGTSYEEVQRQLVQHRTKINSYLTMDWPIHTSTTQHPPNNGRIDSVSMMTLSDASSLMGGEAPVDGATAAHNMQKNHGPDPNYPEFALVITGHSLVYALDHSLELLFLGVAEHCNSVICCRVTPLQKAMVVELVKKYKKAVTLSIGDGANDVSMIKTAHIGVGISGQEGMQAVLASDYSIAQFQFLERLLLVHGRWSYYRMCKFLRYFFYKNFAFTLCHFWYAFFCGFSAQTLFAPMFIAVYNVFYTSQPVLALGIFDQDVDATHSLKFPKLYAPGLSSALFNKREFFKSALHGFISSCFLFFISHGAYHNKTGLNGQGLSDHMLFGSVVATTLVIVVTAQVALDTSYWTRLNHVAIWGSLIFYFALQYFYNYVIFGSYIGSLLMAMKDPTFWFTSLLTTVVLLLPVVAWRFYRSDVHPTLADRVRLLQRHSQIKPREEFRPFSGRRSRRSTRSGYAFAHTEGFGRLTTSGRMMRQQNQVFQPTTSTIHEGPGSTANSKHSDGTARNTGTNTINLNINGRVQEVDLPNQIN